MHEKGIYVKSPNSKWWDGYAGEKIVVFNDFSGSWFKFHDLMAIFDPYPLLVETKGGHVQLLATEFRVSSNYPPLGWYSSQKYPFAALNRRLTKVVHYPYAYPYPLNGAPKVEKDVQPAVPVVHAPSPPSSPDSTPPSSPRDSAESPDEEDEHAWINEVSNFFEHPPQEIADSPQVSASEDEPVAMEEDQVEVTQSDEDADTQPNDYDVEFIDDDEARFIPAPRRRRNTHARNPFVLDEASSDDEDPSEASDSDDPLGSEAEASDSLE